ncbi:MAG TPA: hypothetical protein VK422_19545 [Pyrinomonadaceae bacterium]|nr:hypothetical protein [Pyrinomonadaceae bacterium]
MQTILIADDNEDLRGMLRHLLESQGYRVLEAVAAGCGGFITKPVDPGALLKTVRLLLRQEEGEAAAPQA